MEPPSPTNRLGFEIVIICALTTEADAVETLFDQHWDDDGSRYGKMPGDPNSYSTGSIGRHNVVLAYMPGMGKASSAVVAANCRISFPNIKLALVVGVCGAVPFVPETETEIVLGDVIVSSGIIQYDLGRQLPERFKRKDTLLESLGRPSAEIRTLLAKLMGLRGRKMLRSKMAGHLAKLQNEPELKAEYPGVANDKLFDSKYRHLSDGKTCAECKCDGQVIPRRRFDQGIPQPELHFGLMATGDTVMKSGEERDGIARQENVIGFEMEGAGVWDVFPCVVMKGACDYADSHKTKAWQRYAAATAASCAKAFLDYWVPSTTTSQDSQSQQTSTVKFLVPYTSNPDFIGRSEILDTLKKRLGHTQQAVGTSQARMSLCGLGGTGKTQIAIAYVFWLQKNYPSISIFWVHASSATRFRQAFASIAQAYQIPGYAESKIDVLQLVKDWLENKDHGQWLLVVDNADDLSFFSSGPVDTTVSSVEPEDERNLGRYLPECAHGAILLTTRNKQVGIRLTKGKQPIEVLRMNDDESEQLLRARLEGTKSTSTELSTLSSRLEHLPLALAQSAAFIQETGISVAEYLELLNGNAKDMVQLLSKEFETVGRDPETLHPVAQTWILSFQQIERQHTLASELLSFMSMLDRQDIPTEFISHWSKNGKDGRSRSAIELTEAKGVLKAFSFVTEVRSGSFDMHRLVQLVTHKWLESRGTLGQCGREALMTVSRLYPLCTYKIPARCAEYLSHANSVLQFSGIESEDDAKARGLLLHRVAVYLKTKGKWIDAEKLSKEALQIQEELLGDDHPSTLTIKSKLASIYRSQGRWKEAEELQLQVMEARKSNLGPSDQKTLVSMANLALIYRKQGRYDEAEEIEGPLLTEITKARGPDHPDTIYSMMSLASIYRNQKRFEEAEKLGVQAMEASKRKLGADHLQTLSSMASLGLTYEGQHQLEKAEKLMEQVLETRRKKIGPDHPETLKSMNVLASLWKMQGRDDEALALMKSCVEARLQVLGPTHPRTLASVSILQEWSG